MMNRITKMPPIIKKQFTFNEMLLTRSNFRSLYASMEEVTQISQLVFKKEKFMCYVSVVSKTINITFSKYVYIESEEDEPLLNI